MSLSEKITSCKMDSWARHTASCLEVHDGYVDGYVCTDVGYVMVYFEHPSETFSGPSFHASLRCFYAGREWGQHAGRPNDEWTKHPPVIVRLAREFAARVIKEAESA